MSVIIITCNGCGNKVQMPRADVEAAHELNCGCGSTDLELRDPSGQKLLHRSQVAPTPGQAGPGPEFSGAGMTYKVTCLACGNQVEMDGAQYDAAPRVQCHCGSTDLKVEQPPPNTAELMQAVRQLSSGCPLCRGSGWVTVDDGRMFPCRACQGV